MTPKKVSLRKARYHLSLYLFLAPCVLFIGIFMYFPVINGLYHSFYVWNGGDVERYTGWKNYLTLFTDDPEFWSAFGNALILGCANILKMAPAIITAVCLHRVRSDRLQFIYRVGFVIPMVIPDLVMVLLWKAFYDPTTGILNKLLHASGAFDLLVWFSGLCQHLHAYLGTGFLEWAGNLFQAGANPAWLGESKFAMISLIMWGFPWVGSFGVLCYLACLQSISKDVYEAAEVDGAGWLAKFRYIELPLILRQVRVMMILVVMGSIKDAGLVMALFDIGGGPGGAVQVPALFMFREAFMSQRMGYACGIGVVLFLIILLATRLNQWIVRPAE